MTGARTQFFDFELVFDGIVEQVSKIQGKFHLTFADNDKGIS